jgi:hypothetical protein
MMPQADRPNWQQDDSWNWYDANSLVNPATQTFTSQVTSGWETWDYYSQFRVTQDYWATSPLTIDNVTLANWQKGTPWIDFAMPKWSDILAFTWWEVVKFDSVPWYWTRIIVKDDNGNEHMYNHLSAWNKTFLKISHLEK